MDKFKQVDINSFVAQLKSLGYKFNTYVKVASVIARQGKVGEFIETKFDDEFTETDNVVEYDELTGKTDVVIKNVTGEEYAPSYDSFIRRYNVKDIVGFENKIYKSKRIVVDAVQIHENIVFIAPWGRSMKVKAGGYLVVTNHEIYGVQQKAFDRTYAKCDSQGNLI